MVRNLRESSLGRVTTCLIQQLDQRDQLLAQRQRHCDLITAILQASSPKRSKPVFSPIHLPSIRQHLLLYLIL